ncbi:hypothetical protein C8Q76DRAFT_629637 [Earliella scabrosa]|nr:hypothetical protein C8Q76DRAFT_629637 [Earliella scabrosa]
MLERDGLTPPKDTTIESAKIQRHGDVVFTLSCTSAAKWLLRQHVATAFARKMGMEARVVERTYKLVAERVPIDFDPQDSATLRAVEEAHGLKSEAIARADWIKPVERRRLGQRFAYLMLTVTGVEQANRALRGLTLAGRRVLVRREIEEPKRCMRCQRLDGHFAKDCPASHDVCARCAGAHPTTQCTVNDPSAFKCANCGQVGHATWDLACSERLAKVRALAARKADSGFRFFVTNNPETWVPEEEELARAPPPPTVWSQIQHRFDAADQGLQQTRLGAGAFIDNATRPTPRNTQ